jgi:hypothetical protein
MREPSAEKTHRRVLKRARPKPADRGAQLARRPERVEPQAPTHVALTWLQRLKRVFGVEIQTCQRCGGPLKVIASIEDPMLIERILAHLERPAADEGLAPFASRGPLQLPLL